MKFDSEIETRAYPPIEIPRRQMIMHFPDEWLKILSGENVAQMVMQWIFGGGGDEVREDLEEKYPSLNAYSIPGKTSNDFVRVCIPIRENHFLLLEETAAIVGRGVHEVFCRVLARQITFHIDEDGEIEKALDAYRKERTERKSKIQERRGLVAKIIPFPSDLFRH